MNEMVYKLARWWLLSVFICLIAFIPILFVILIVIAPITGVILGISFITLIAVLIVSE